VGVRVLSSEAQRLLRKYPGWAQNAPEHQAICVAVAGESERMRSKMREVRDGMIPITANALTLPLWETLYKLPVNPEGMTVEQRRARVLSAVLVAPPDASGLGWEARITALLGASWSYEEEEGAGEKQQRIKVLIAAPPGSVTFEFAKRIIERERPAAWQILVESTAGFVLDKSKLDLEAFHPS
jgi:hypothetical protein